MLLLDISVLPSVAAVAFWEEGSSDRITASTATLAPTKVTSTAVAFTPAAVAIAASILEIATSS